MVEVVDSTTGLTPPSLVEVVHTAGFAVTDDVRRLENLAGTVQLHRNAIKVSSQRAATRTTTLWSAMQLDDPLRAALERSGISSSGLERQLKLDTTSFEAVPATEGIHEDFVHAMSTYLSERTRPGPVGLAEVVLAILVSARDRSRGRLSRRVSDVEPAIRAIGALLDASSTPEVNVTPAFEPSEFSGSIRGLRRTFGEDPAVTPGRIAVALQSGAGHETYAEGRFPRAPLTTTGPGAPFDEWCARVRGLYDMNVVRESEGHVLDGRMMLVGLAVLDADFEAQLKGAGLLDALRTEAKVRPRETALPAGLRGGVSREYVDPTEGIGLDKDRLGAATYVSMLATVICDRKTDPPLSVGLFGEWGSGKSFFMGLLRGRIEYIASTSGGDYFHDIRQISFNAWHYADSNLWASLGDEIFRQLLHEADPQEERQKQLRCELGELNTQRRELNSVVEHAETEAGRLRTEIAQATLQRDVTAQNLLDALANTSEAKLLTRAWRQLGIHDNVEQARVLAAEVNGTLTESVALRRSLTGGRGLLVALLAVGILLVVVGFAIWGSSLEAVVRSVTAGAGALLAAAVTVVAATRRGLTDLRDVINRMQAGVQKSAEANRATLVAERLQELRAAEAARDLAQNRLVSVKARIAELGRELAELAPGERLYGFLAERIEAGDYTRNLGLISTIRKDFERLIVLMAQWRDERAKQEASARAAKAGNGSDDEAEPVPSPPPDPARRPIDRIVLYIDDLDRCTPRQVVDVLQAVHLLMALDLFVVVVGVDPRWLVRSLRDEYPKLLDPQLARADDHDAWDVTPEDYLEKIFGIPIVLPGMVKGSLDGIIRGMTVDGSSSESETTPSGEEPGPTVGDAEDLPTIGTAVGQTTPSPPITPSPPTPALIQPRPLVEDELALLAALEPLVDTPREAKRITNIYRMIRASDFTSPARFMGDDGKPAEYRAVVPLLGLLTTHARLLGAVLDSPSDPTAVRPGGLMARTSGTWADFVAGMEPACVGDTWSNNFVPSITAEDRRAWVTLRRGLQPVTELVGQTELREMRDWAPRIRRFSFVLSSV